MSTFNGVVEEFPEIRIDRFRTVEGRTPPLACFLSHVHSDHLQGLESLKSPFVYCSLATRELLLRLEKYPHRMNFEKGILETRKQHYRHLSNLLKTIPLNTPTEIELSLGNQIRVTLLDANHCAGAVMFLIENHKKAVLYTGDIRSEPWWVNTLARNPIVLPYTLGQHRLDKIYLDTTYATKRDQYRSFPTKADGLKELLTKVLKYPKETVFHFDAWTLGYEDVWIALASSLGSQVHVDRYKLGLYSALASTHGGKISSQEGPALCGFMCGNRAQTGCLTRDHKVRLHSCERDTDCATLGASGVVWITSIITRSMEGTNLPEIGAGGGGGVLTQHHEVELNDPEAVLRLVKLCCNSIRDKQAQSRTLELIATALASHTQTMMLDAVDPGDLDDAVPLEKLVELLSDIADRTERRNKQERSSQGSSSELGSPERHMLHESDQRLPQIIHFPYSRHSSYDELCHLVKLFEPIDIHPCTTDEESWTWDQSIKSLFGHLCSGSTFSHDKEMSMLEDRRKTSDSHKRGRGSRQRNKVSNDDSETSKRLEPCGNLSVNSELLPVRERLLKRLRVGHYSMEWNLHGNDSSSSASDLLPVRKRLLKRLRINRESPKTFNESHPIAWTTSSEASSYEQRLNDMKGSFEEWLKQPNSKAVASDAEEVGSTLQLAKEVCFASSISRSPAKVHCQPSMPLNTALSGSSRTPFMTNRVDTNDPIENLRTPLNDTKSKTIEASDKDSDSTPIAKKVNLSEFGYDGANDSYDNETMPGTQISLSDSTFESQPSHHHAAPNLTSPKVQRRKEAYAATRELNLSGRGDGVVLISSSAGHGEEELEL